MVCRPNITEASRGDVFFCRVKSTVFFIPKNVVRFGLIFKLLLARLKYLGCFAELLPSCSQATATGLYARAVSAESVGGRETSKDNRAVEIMQASASEGSAGVLCPVS